MTTDSTTIHELLNRVEAGDDAARDQLLESQRFRLRGMVSARLDKRIVARLDASDVVQEVLLKASDRLSDYARRRPLPLYPWLRQLAWDRLVELHHKHVAANRRSVNQEVDISLPDHSAIQLANRLGMSQTSPSKNLIRSEMIERLHRALEGLEAGDREVLMMKYLEELSTDEIAATMHVSRRTIQLKHRRGPEQLQRSLDS